jgi:hypothetical protein
MSRKVSTSLVGLACVAVCAWGSGAAAAELGRIEIAEPLGVDWPDEWITREVTIDTGSRDVPPERLQVETTVRRRVREGGKRKTVERKLVLPAQFYDARTGKLLAAGRAIGGRVKLKVYFAAVLQRDQTQTFLITDGGGPAPAWRPISIREAGGKTTVTNGVYELVFDAADPRPINALRAGSVRGTMGTFHWPKSVEVAGAGGVEDRWLERGPARAILERKFRLLWSPESKEARSGGRPRQPEIASPFKSPRYEVRFEFRAGDPWIDVTDSYDLGAGSFVELDLGALGADFVYHPHTYNARTFKPDGKSEDSTLQPPQHPIATLGPIWRDIWFGGGPVAFVYNSRADHGVGLAAVRGSEWRTPDGVSPESQNLAVYGDRSRPGQVRVRIPTDRGSGRRWALVFGPPDVRKRMHALVRARADVPLQRVLDEWVLRWDSKHRDYPYGFAKQWFGPFNRHLLNPTTFPRRVRSDLRRLIDKGEKVRSRDLAMLAYVFADPNYWPGPRYKWRIGNPNFNTDMYNVVLQVALVMPDHPHAKRWLEHGARELKTNVYRDSFPGGAWAESLSYAGFFFHIADYADQLRRAKAAAPFKDWPRMKEVLTYLACMHTPVDPRYGSRQKAPIGDTGPGNYVARLRKAGRYYRGVDDRFARQLERFGEKWPGALDLSSREFFGFGAMLRGSAYDDRHESFVTIKAGPARNHFQGDELSFYFASLGTPLAIDYACHYSPRPWSAAIHNRPNLEDLRPVAVGVRRAFRTSGAADVFVADEKTRRLNHVPMEPHLATKPGWNYEWSELPADRPWVLRRYAMLVKHDPKASKIPDYLVIRDEIDSPRTAWWNLHVLARDLRRDGRRVFFPGQLGVDLTAHFLTPEPTNIEKRRWGWGGTMKQRRGLKGAEYEKACFGRYVPEDFRPGTWKEGEMAQGLRVRGAPGRTKWLVVLMPRRRGEPAATVEKLSPTSARIALGRETEVVHLGTEGACQAAVERGGRRTALLKAGELKPPGELPFVPAPPGMDPGAL